MDSLCRESLRGFRHAGVERKDHSNGIKSQVEEGYRPVFEGCGEVSTTIWKFDLSDYHTTNNMLFNCCCFSVYAHPITSHLDAAKRILRYVKESLSHGLWYKRCGIFFIEWVY